MYALIQNGVVWELSANRLIWTTSQDVRDVSTVAGIAVGWTVAADGTFAAPASVAETTAQLVAYAKAKALAWRDGGITVNVGSTSAPVEVDVASDVNGRDLVAGNVQYAGLCSQAGQPAPTFNWINDSGAKITLTAPQMMSIGLTLRAFVQATYDALGAMLADIANGAVTTTAQIDAVARPSTNL